VSAVGACGRGAGGWPALLLAAHGSRSPAGADEALALARRVDQRHPDLAVGCGFIELAPPPLADAAAELVAAGHDDVVVVPLVLLDAGHAKTDVPASVNLAREAHPNASFRYGRALGVHPQVLAACAERIDAAAPADRDEVSVLLVGRGATDPDANAELARAARLLWEGRGFAHVEAAYVGLTRPDVSQGLQRLRALGARTIVVLSYFLFTGLLEDRVRQQAAEFDAAHDDVAVVAAGHLGVNDRVADLAVERYHEAAVGAPPRSCDTCVYRVAMPGFEDRVGSPLAPHHHPDDPATHDHGPVGSPPQPHHHPHDPATHDHGPGGSPLQPHHHPHDPTTHDHGPTPVPGSETSRNG
jgi:sirohydrochlorin cobaltochelatase